MGDAELGQSGCHQRKGHPSEAEVQLEKQCLGREVSRICAPNHELDSLLWHRFLTMLGKVVMEKNLPFCLFACFWGGGGLSIMKQGKQILFNIK